MKSSAVALFSAVIVLSLTGAVAGSVVAPMARRMRAEEPALRLSSSGAMLALFGGYRGLVADAFWLKMHAAWERRDRAATEVLVRIVSDLDPRLEYFWKNGARIIAYDVPAWRILEAGGYDAVPADEQRRIMSEQARLALAHLETALGFHPESSDLWIERANIEYGRLRDFGAAAESYRRAAEQKNAPAYAARLHAEMLRRGGRKAEALAWLVKLHPMLPPDDEAAAADVVLERIRELERELEVKEAEAYVAEHDKLDRE